ncbi:MAG TPA: quinone oxidoreductase [Solirubrobacter sp.]|nr:quinone oxidoreductase [Solirubrobacter sp.]
MRAIQITRRGGPEVLELADVPEPEGELIVDVEAIGVNYRDVYERSGVGAYENLPLPRVVGAEGAGTVVRGAGEFAAGDRVAWVETPCYAERAAVPVEQAVRIPDGVSSEYAAAVLLQGMTAHYLCTSTYAVRDGDVVVVHAAAGGVGLLLTQLVKARGGVVVATTGTAEKAALAREVGADHTVTYGEFGAVVRELGGAHVVYDGVGAATFEAGLDVLRPRGTMVLYGQASGPAPRLDPQSLQPKSLYVTRPGLPDYIATREELERRAAAVLDGSLDVRIGGRYPLEEARRAHEDLEARRTTGKLLLYQRNLGALLSNA